MPDATVRVTVPTEGLPAPQASNYSRFTWSGPEVQMLLGYIDLQQLHDAADNVEEAEDGEAVVIDVPVEVSHRVSMSLRGFFHLASQIEEISASMRKGGVVFPGDDEDEEE